VAAISLSHITAGCIFSGGFPGGATKTSAKVRIFCDSAKQFLIFRLNRACQHDVTLIFGRNRRFFEKNS
jgi:hypothetical protein